MPIPHKNPHPDADSQHEMMIDIAHGLQTPLTIITGELHFLKKDFAGNKRLEVCERMVREMSLLIYDLLHLARIDRADLSRSMETIDLSALAREVVEYASVLAEEKGIDLSSRIAPDVFVEGVRERVEELIINLVANSMKYMKSEGPRRISVELSADAKSAALTVADTGVGIAPEHLPHVFTRFYRVKQRDGKAVSGSGLGLAIAQKIAEKHNAKISIESEVGKGTKVSVRFPRLSA